VNVDVLVAGAGPAGCAAAVRLVRDGAQACMVHHESTNQRPSEVLPAAASQVLDAAGLGPVDGLAEARCGGTLSVWGSAQLIAGDGLTSPGGPGWWIDRPRFDAAMRRRCMAAGVTVMTDRVVGLRRVGSRLDRAVGQRPGGVRQVAGGCDRTRRRDWPPRGGGSPARITSDRVARSHHQGA
jgi:flavin-dependent dehydrogenase